MKKISAILLAAGESVRMGTNKLLLAYQGKTLLEHLFTLVQTVDFHECILVISRANAQHIEIPAEMQVIYNDYLALGQSYSVRLGVEAATGEGYLFFTADQPLLTVELVQQMMAQAATERIVFPIKEDGTPSSPTLFGMYFREELLALEGKGGGSSVRNRHPEACVPIVVDCPEQLKDIDTPQGYLQLLQLEHR